MGGLQLYDFKAIKLKTLSTLRAASPCKKVSISFNSSDFVSFAEISIYNRMLFFDGITGLTKKHRQECLCHHCKIKVNFAERVRRSFSRF